MTTARDSITRVPLPGDGHPSTSRGHADVTHSPDALWLTLPDRDGHETPYAFAPDDALGLVEAIHDHLTRQLDDTTNRTEIHRALKSVPE